MKTMFGNWLITVNKEQNFVQANWCDIAPRVEADFFPDWGVGDTGKTIEEAAISCIKMVWEHELGGICRAVELASAMMALQIIPQTVRIDEQAAILDGVWYFGHSDMDYLNRTGVTPWYEFMGYRKISELKMSPEALKLAKAIAKAAWEEAKSWSKAYDAWEGSWIDGSR